VKPLRFGLIGTGAAGRARARLLRARQDTELVATCGPGPHLDVMHFEDAAGLFGRADLDAVIHAGPAAETIAILSGALERGLHVLSLRTGRITPEDRIILRRALATAAGRVVQFSFPLHHHASVATARALIRSGGLGGLVNLRGLYSTVRAPRAAGRGGVLADKGLHMLDLMSMFAGPFTEVKSFLAQSVWGDAGCDDNAFGLLRSREGVIAQLHASATWWRETFRLELGLEQGYLWLDGLTGGDDGLSPEMLIIGHIEHDGAGNPIANPEEQIHEFKVDNAGELELADFLHAVRGRGPQTVGTLAQALDALDLVERVRAADETWQARRAHAAE